MQRLIRIASSFAIVLVAYCAYALVAVPLIEPPAKHQRASTITDQQRAAAEARIHAAIAEFQGLFPPGAWELENPVVLESGRIKLLTQGYKNLGGGRAEIHPCTIIFLPELPDADEAQRKRQAVILEAPDGAVLEFDGPLNLQEREIGRLLGCQLMGPITIRSKGKLPGTEDDLQVVTREVEVTERNIITPHAVDFRYGRHYGHGGQMRIKLLAPDKPSPGNRHQPQITGIETFELRRLERLHLEMGQLELTDEKSPTNLADGADTLASDLPIEITCQGTFRFDVVRKVATFEDRVTVLRTHPNGPSDQLNCELLSVFFADRHEPTSGAADDAMGSPNERPAGSLDLRPQRIEARGEPVVMLAPTEGVHARGERLQYDLDTGRIVLEAGREAMLRQATNEIHARSLSYQPGEKGQLGRIAAQGPGWLRGRIDKRPDDELQARWNGQLRVRPHDGNQVISLDGGARLDFPGIGQLEAGEIHLWLSESEPKSPDGKPTLRPDRMLAQDAVQIDSAEFSGTVERLEAWFEPAAAAQAAIGPTSRQPPAVTADGPFVAAAFMRSSAPLAEAAPMNRGTTNGPGEPPPARQRHLQISGRLLRANMALYEDGRTELAELTIENNVLFIETQTEKPDERPLLIRGDRLHVVDANKPHAAVTITGRPAHFRGRGLALTGPTINLNRGTNRLWIDDAGQMDLVMDRNLEGRPLQDPEMLQVTWQDSMEFDGRTARFQGAVTADATRLHLRTDTLEIELKQPIDFSADAIGRDPDVARLQCWGGVFMENSSFDDEPQTIGQPAQTSHEKMQVADLVIHVDSGALSAHGPGWLNSVSLQSGNPLDAAGGGLLGSGTAAEDAQGADDDPQLWGLHVRFLGPIEGNAREGRQQMTFHNQVRTAYAPVDSWSAVPPIDDPDALGDRGVLIRCDLLSVNETPLPGSDRGGMELMADGNTTAEGNAFFARAARMSYAQAKDLLILEGDGRTDAELFHQPQIGGQTSKHAARKILYWPKADRLEIEGARSFQFNGRGSEHR